MSDNIHSHGRGGAGNIGIDNDTYVDGDIVREGVSDPTVTHVGRGGAGNVPSPRTGTPVSAAAKNPGSDAVPETATRSAEGHENYHTGRGGEGNIHRDRFGGHSKAPHEHHEGGLVDKAKHLLGMDKKTQGTTEPGK